MLAYRAFTRNTSNANRGQTAEQRPLSADIPSVAAALERAGFDWLWVSGPHRACRRRSHRPIRSRPTGSATWPTDTPYVDALDRARARRRGDDARPPRHRRTRPAAAQPGAARQAGRHRSTSLSGGRLELGVGAGWLARGSPRWTCPFDGARRPDGRVDRDPARVLDGSPAERATSEFYDLPEGTLVPARARAPIPLLIGGHSPAALRRAARQRRLARAAGRGPARPGGARVRRPRRPADRRLARPRGSSWRSGSRNSRASTR